MSAAAAPPVPDFPATERRVIFLLDAASRLEERLLRRWIETQTPDGHEVACMEIPASRRRRGRIDPKLEPALAAGDDPLLAPLRIAWLAQERDGRRSARLSDLLKLGDPRDPNRIREHLVRWRDADRCRIVAGEPAPASELRERWQRQASHDQGHTVGFAGFVARQAALALERAERRVRGARYKVPRLVHEDILARPPFRGELSRLAAELGRSDESVLKEATANLREIAASHSPFVIDLVVEFWRQMYSRSYGDDLHYDPEEIARIRALAQQHPVVFLPTHKSNLDHGVLQSLLHENGLPPNHTAGGINMNFFPLGPLVRRAGVFFIRRSFKDDVIYKVVLRHYIDYLVEKRFPLEWYIEGGRSRSGKLLPPRFGLLAYVVDAYRRGRSDDVALIPVSINYDQISDVGDYAAEQLGAEKERESFRWLIRILRRMGTRYGQIHVRFGEPLSLAKALGPSDPDAAPDPNEQNLALQKVAFEVCVRINRSTPITPISLVCLALLGRGDRALSRPEMVQALGNLVDYVARRGLPTSEALDLHTTEGVGRTLDELVESGLLECYDSGPEPVYQIAPDQHLAAAYYRNAVIHNFVGGAILELSLVRAGEPDVEDRPAAFWAEAMALRDLLKFEFFFAEKEAYRTELREEMALQSADFEEVLRQGPEAIHRLLQQLRPFHAHRILRPFLEAYRVIGDALERHGPDEAIEAATLEREGLALGRQYVLQRHVKRRESVSKALFQTAVKLVKNRELWEPGDVAEGRAELAAEIRAAIRRVDAIESLARARQVGLAP